MHEIYYRLEPNNQRHLYYSVDGLTFDVTYLEILKYSDVGTFAEIIRKASENTQFPEESILQKLDSNEHIRW